ncbi:MAG: hypothetical protein HY077_11330 [Elusimicrobia bacterium]|nr:hypothetical protein [Elusimicrobiota bacterium]
MAKNVLFLIHGIGRNGPDWAEGPDGPIAALQTASQRYVFFKGKDLRDLVDFVPILYDDLLAQILNQWQDMAQGLQGVAGAAPEAIRMLLDLQTKYADDKNTIVAFGGDVPLYRGFRQFAQRVQLRVILRIAEEVAKRYAAAAGDAPQFVVVAHSLGTTVAHDSLHLLGSVDWLSEEVVKGPCGAAQDADEYKAADAALSLIRKVPNPFAPGYLAFKAVFMLSNTSELLQSVCSPENSLVCPIKREDAAAPYCQSFYNVDHALDPISKVVPFKMPGDWGKNGKNIVVDHLYDPNVHAFVHYLQNPQVHIPLLMKLVDDFAPTTEEVTAAKNFPRFGGRLITMADAAKTALVDKLQAIIAAAAAPAVDQLRRWRNTYEALAAVTEGGVGG